MGLPRLVVALTLAAALAPTPALAAEIPGAVSPVLSTGAGILALVFAAALLVEMLVLRRLSTGSALADNISFAVLATVCLAASVLVGWVGRFVDSTFTADQARLGSDLLGVVAIVLFGVYFHRVRRAMSRFLGRLATQEEDLVVAVHEETDRESENA